jgi:hypothetical protein
MAKKSTTFEARYRSWANSIPKGESSPFALVNKIKERYFDQQPSDNEEDYFLLMYFLQKRAKTKYTAAVKEGYRALHIKPLEVYTEITSCVFERFKKAYPKLKENMVDVKEDGKPGYLHRVLKRMLTRCEVTWLKDYVYYYNDKTELPSYEGDMYVPPELTNDDPFAHLDLQYTEEQNKAKDLAQYIQQEWDYEWRNVLCEYLDCLYDKKSPRLSEENEAYLHTLHSRVKKRLQDLVARNICTKEVLCKIGWHYEKEICQKTPISTTYKPIKQKPTK